MRQSLKKAGLVALLPAGLFVAGAVALTFSFVARPAIGQAGGAENVKVGVVGLAKVFEEYKKTKELEERINQERDKLKGELDAQRNRIKELNKEMELLDSDGDTYKLKEEERYLEAARLDLFKKRIERSIKIKWEEYNLLLLEDIEDVVSNYGKQNGYTLILKVEGQQDDENKLPLFGLKNVMYFAPHIDITTDVVQILNQRYSVGEDKSGSGNGK
ncbi:MAG: OmpH/Skp family outer membrane protein [Planctomycetota bacterium]